MDITGDIKEQIDYANGQSKTDNGFSRQSSTVRIKDQCEQQEFRGAGILKPFHRLFQRLDRWVERFIPESLNPFTQAGAIANTTFVISLVSGFVLLLWYKPSVYQAYESLQTLNPAGEFFRALHRYSSDACMLFILFHASKVFFSKRFGGARWLAWVTGLIALGLLWFDGWLGYWLVWDERANLVATGTAKMLDILPIFAEPLTRSFLTDESFNSLLFFLVFFFHMLIPLGMGIALWLHVSRMNKSHFITGNKMTWILIGSLTLISILFPADLSKPADMLEVQESMPLDYFYMIPLYLTDRLEGGMLWALFLLASVAFVSVPWALVKKKLPKPSIDPDRCNGCEQCYLDCPYNAISMIPRSKDDNKNSDFFASVDPSKCMACGICVGACDPMGVDFPRLPAMETRKEIDRWIEKQLEQNGRTHVAFICANSAGADLQVDPETGRCEELPGYIVRSVPCSGWVHPLMVERALRKGADGVLITGCRSAPEYRLGASWTEQRLDGKREPSPRRDKIDMDKVKYLQYNPVSTDTFLEDARKFRSETGPVVRKNQSTIKRWTAAGFITLMLGSLTYFFSKAPYQTPEFDSSLVVSFTLPGKIVQTDDKPQNQQNRLSHMRNPDAPAERKRADVRMKIVVDGETVIDKSYSPMGLFNDGSSTAIEELSLSEGKHTVRVYLGDTTEKEWRYQDTRELVFEENNRKVLLFNRSEGFRWYPSE